MSLNISPVNNELRLNKKGLNLQSPKVTQHKLILDFMRQQHG